MSAGQASRGRFPTGLISNNFENAAELQSNSLLNRIIDITQTDGGILITSLDDTDLQVIDAGGGNVSIKAGVAHDKFGQRIILETDDIQSGEYVSTVDLSAGVDLSTNHLTQINIDGAGAVEIDCQGAVPATTTIDEILTAINAAGFGTIAYRADSGGNPIDTGDYILVKSITQGLASILEFTAPSATDATFEIFGLSEAAYPHTFTGGGGYAVPNDNTSYNVIIEYLLVQQNVGSFKAGYPAASDTEYMEQVDGYRITVTADDPVDNSLQQEFRLATVVNDGGTLTITDRRGDHILYLQGTRTVDSTPPPAPTKVFLRTWNVNSSYGIELKWNKVNDPSGIKKYIIERTLTHEDGVALETPIVSYSNYENTLDTSELTYQLLIAPLPQGQQYTVKVAAQDNSLSQNISPFTDFGTVIIGQLLDDAGDPKALETMPATTNAPINNGVEVDWPDLTQATEYEYTYATLGKTPQFDKDPTFKTPNSKVTIQGSPGESIKVRVRAIYADGTKSKDVTAETIAGGTIIGSNEKVLPLRDASVNKDDEGKAARFLGYLRLPNPANIVELSAYVTNVILNSAEKATIRVYKDNAEADAVSVTFDEAGLVELPIDDLAVEAGWLIVDAYDNQETGTDQAEYTADIFVVYAEGVVRTGATKGKDGDDINL